MGKGLRMMNLWPGVSVLYARGSFAALVVALLFGLMLNLILAGLLVWPELLSVGAMRLLLGTLVLTSIGSLLMSERFISPREDAARTASAEKSYRRAVELYLQGEWFETETVLRELLRLSPRDLEARLMLATLYRHTERPDDAEQQLRHLLRLENSWTLEVEIHREWQLVRQMHEAAESVDEAETGVETEDDADALTDVDMDAETAENVVDAELDAEDRAEAGTETIAGTESDVVDSITDNDDIAMEAEPELAAVEHEPEQKANIQASDEPLDVDDFDHESPEYYDTVQYDLPYDVADSIATSDTEASDAAATDDVANDEIVDEEFPADHEIQATDADDEVLDSKNSTDENDDPMPIIVSYSEHVRAADPGDGIDAPTGDLDDTATVGQSDQQISDESYDDFPEQEAA